MTKDERFFRALTKIQIWNTNPNSQEEASRHLTFLREVWSSGRKIDYTHERKLFEQIVGGGNG